MLKARVVCIALWVACCSLCTGKLLGQESAAEGDGTQRIVIQAEGKKPKPTPLYRIQATGAVKIGIERIEQATDINIVGVQGEVEKIVLGIEGVGLVKSVKGKGVTSWSVRQREDKRSLEIYVDKSFKELNAQVVMTAETPKLPAVIELSNLTAGEAIGFASVLSIRFDAGLTGQVAEASKFFELSSPKDQIRLQSSEGGAVRLSVNRVDALQADAFVTNASLQGQLDESGKALEFTLEGTVEVTEEAAQLMVLSGDVAVSALPTSENYKLRLKLEDGMPSYNLEFEEAGTFDFSLAFVASTKTMKAGWESLSFQVAASPVMPLKLSGLPEELEFMREAALLAPERTAGAWSSYIPANGAVNLKWRIRKSEQDGKLFYNTSSIVEATVGPGLMRQTQSINYQVLQGELSKLLLLIDGPGEITNVQCDNLVAWRVDEGDQKRLVVELSRAVKDKTVVTITSQLALNTLPANAEGMTLTPAASTRHSGYLRVSSIGSVGIEPSGLEGLMQLAPNQYPGPKREARQSFFYRFPNSTYRYQIAADRIQPEVSVAELIVYEFAESELGITANVELDIREAAIRDWSFELPSDYSVVSVTGAALADYLTAVEDGKQSLKVVFREEVMGRQLLQLRLEKTESITDGTWVLPKIVYPETKNQRSEIGIVAEPGFRIKASDLEQLVEMPISYFSAQQPNLQQAFRSRDSGWKATGQIEKLDQSILVDTFHLHSLSKGTVYGSVLLNYFITGAPADELKISVPGELLNLTVDGQDIRTWRKEDDNLIVTLQQAVMGPYTLLVSFEQKPSESDSSFQAGTIEPQGVAGEQGYIQVVSPVQVELETLLASEQLLELDFLELPAEFRLLSTAPTLATWQYTERPFELRLKVDWFRPGSTSTQVVEFADANSKVSADGQLVTDLEYFVKTRGQQNLRIKLPEDPVKLWGVKVNGQPVTARKNGDETLIPLPMDADPNIPVKISLGIAKPAVSEQQPLLALPVVLAPVLKTQWKLTSNENYVLLPQDGNVNALKPSLSPTGLEWVASKGLPIFVLVSVLLVAGSFLVRRTLILSFLGLVLQIAALAVACVAVRAAVDLLVPTKPLELHLPVLAAGEEVTLQVSAISTWLAHLSWPGIGLIAAGVIGICWGFASSRKSAVAMNWLPICVCMIAFGVLLQRLSGPWFFGFLAVSIFLFAVLPNLVDLGKQAMSLWRSFRSPAEESPAVNTPEVGAVTNALLPFLFAMLSFGFSDQVSASYPLDTKQEQVESEVTVDFKNADAIKQNWQIDASPVKLSAQGEIQVSGNPGDRFELLKAPAVLTAFRSESLRLSKVQMVGGKIAYFVSIPYKADAEPDDGDSAEEDDGSANADANAPATHTGQFKFLVESVNAESIPVFTGSAAVQEVELTYATPGWTVSCDAAAKINSSPDAERTKAKILLLPTAKAITIRPPARNIESEATRFFCEGASFYLAGPGVVDGKHKFEVRASQGRVKQLEILVPQGITVGAVNGPIESWRFDAETQVLMLQIDRNAPSTFNVMIDTQQSLDELPDDVTLEPLRVNGSENYVGSIALAFGPDAQPGKLDVDGLTQMSLKDVDKSWEITQQQVLHRVFGYSNKGGKLTVQVLPVAPSIRIVSRQAISLGSERIVLSDNFTAIIARAGIFQLSFDLPAGLEVESLTGQALDHWSELETENGRRVILHLKEKTIGQHQFSLSLFGAAPGTAEDWTVPTIQFREASREVGFLVLQPATGLQLRTVTRQNVSEVDPREMGGQGKGALAFRLLQSDWSITLGLEQLDPWITGQMLHEVTLREGQVRHTLIGELTVENSAIRSLNIELPLTNDESIKSLRASGVAVGDFVRVEDEENTWQLQLKRRVIGRLQFQIEYQKLRSQGDKQEVFLPADIKEARQVDNYFAFRIKGRLDATLEKLTDGWEQIDWNNVPVTLREAGNENSPMIVVRAINPTTPLAIQTVRHAIEEALKLRVAQGNLTTVLSPTGDQLTMLDATLEVLQRSRITVQLPEGGDLFSIFVNGESVNTVRRETLGNAWQFNVLPGIDDNSANLKLVYALSGGDIRQLKIVSPLLDVPLENIEWNVIVPEEFNLVRHQGNVELIRESSNESYNRDSYLEKVTGIRMQQAQQASRMLQEANQFLQRGEQTKAKRALSSVANQYGLDAASNEDARIQLENLQRQQAIVGLNTRRQRLFLENGLETMNAADEQLREAATENPLLRNNQLNFQPQQMSQLLGGNTLEENEVLQQLASRFVRQQHASDPAPQAIVISMPSEGRQYTFSRSVQVAENASLELELDFATQAASYRWRNPVAIALLGLFAFGLLLSARSRRNLAS